MADPLIVQEWLKMAEDDFCFAETNLKAGSEFYAQICFHFQQAAEKYLKAYIIGKGLAFEKVHDLVHLLKTCSAYEPAFATLKEDCILLNTALTGVRVRLSLQAPAKLRGILDRPTSFSCWGSVHEVILAT